MRDSNLYQIGGIQLVVAGFLVLVALGALVSRLLQRPIRRLFAADEHHRVGGSIFANLVRFLVWGTVIAVICDQCFGIDAAGIVSALGVMGIAVSLGGQQTIANIIGGLIVSMSRVIAPGDWVSVGGSKESEVIDIDWRKTTLMDEDGLLYVVPNSKMVSETVAKGNSYYMVVIPFALRTDVDDVEALLVDCEQALLDRMVARGLDHNEKRPKAHVVATEPDVIRCEVKIYPNRRHDTRHVLRAAAPALVGLLQERHVMAHLLRAE